MKKLFKNLTTVLLLCAVIVLFTPNTVNAISWTESKMANATSTTFTLVMAYESDMSDIQLADSTDPLKPNMTVEFGVDSQCSKLQKIVFVESSGKKWIVQNVLKEEYAKGLVLTKEGNQLVVSTSDGRCKYYADSLN